MPLLPSRLRAAGGALLAVAAAAPSASFTGPVVSVYDFASQHCQPVLPQPGCNLSIDKGCDGDVPDAPVRAWWNGSSFFLLSSVDLGSRGLHGPTLDSLVHSCGLYANSTNDMDMSAYDDHSWVHSSWFFPGNNSVYALTHDEYHCDRAGCPDWPNPPPGEAYLSAVVLKQSVGLGGLSGWESPDPANPGAAIVAAMPFVWNESIGAGGQTFGMRSPSGVLRTREAGEGGTAPPGYYYASITANWGSATLGQQAGACMARSRDITDPSSWRLWDGTGFNSDFSVNPWTSPPAAPGAAPVRCVPFSNITYPSLLWSSYYRRYMIFGTHEGDDRGGWIFGLSDDLVSWDSWTDVADGGFIAQAGNGTVGPLPSPLPGRFVMSADPSASAVFWENPAGSLKYPVGSCTPCPGVAACGNVTRLPDGVFFSIPNATHGFSCGLVYPTSGYSDFFYPTIIDPSVAPSRPNFDEVGQSARLFLVGQRCVNANAEPDGTLACSPFDPDGVLHRDVVQIPIAFAGGATG